MKKNDSIREMTVNFILYPGEKIKLENHIDQLIKKNNQKSIAKSPAGTKNRDRDYPVKAIISPHGGWVHCDTIMASAYNSVAKRDIRTVIILSRVHREPAKALFLPDFSFYETPLGNVEVDQDLLSAIADTSKYFQFSNIPHVEEHSIEVQLPFVKYLWPEAKIVPLLTGKSLKSLTGTVTGALKAIPGMGTEQTLIIISSSLSSYNTADRVRTEADRFFTLLENREKWSEIPELLRKEEIGACSGDSVSAVLAMLKSDLSVDMLDVEYGEASDPMEKRVCFGALSIRGGMK